MSANATIRCNCGHRISSKDILRCGIMMAQWKPLYRYVRYRCSRCKKLGERVVDYEKWDDAQLDEAEVAHVEVAEAERLAFERLGKITCDEVIEFAERLGVATCAEFPPL